MPDRFQSTRPRGARHLAIASPKQAKMFQSTRPRGARLSTSTRGRTASCFNPRAHVGRDTTAPAPTTPARCFNPRAHVGRDKLISALTRPEFSFQSTRPRGARQMDIFSIGRPACVSIHAPTWGATTSTASLRCRTTSFNPRAHVGRDSLLGNKLKIKFKDKHFRENIKTKRKMAANRRKNKSNQLILKHCECHKISCNGTRSQPPHTLGIVQQSQYQRIGNIDGGFLPDPFYSSFPIIS